MDIFTKLYQEGKLSEEDIINFVKSAGQRPKTEKEIWEENRQKLEEKTRQAAEQNRKNVAQINRNSSTNEKCEYLASLVNHMGDRAFTAEEIFRMSGYEVDSLAEQYKENNAPTRPLSEEERKALKDGLKKLDLTGQQTYGENTAPENVIPENTAPENVIPENTTPENTAPENTAPENTAPENTAPENTVQQGKRGVNLHKKLKNLSAKSLAKIAAIAAGIGAAGVVIALAIGPVGVFVTTFAAELGTVATAVAASQLAKK